MELKYKHQQEVYEKIKKMKPGESLAYSFPVGCGKSFPVLKLIEENPEKEVLVIVPSVALKNQFKEYMNKYLMDDSQKNESVPIYEGESEAKQESENDSIDDQNMNNQKVNDQKVNDQNLNDQKSENLYKTRYPNVRFVTYQGLARIEDVSKINPDIIICDEMHRMGAKVWGEKLKELFKNNTGAKIIGMSATPERNDNVDIIEEFFGYLSYELTLTDALSGDKTGEVLLGGLNYVKVISELDESLKARLDSIESIKDEKLKAQLLQKYERLNKAISTSPELSEVLGMYMKNKEGKYIVFCSDVEDLRNKMQNVSKMFGKVNPLIDSSYICVKSGNFGKSQTENERTIREFENAELNGHLKLLFCIDMLNEGIHLSNIDGAIMCRPTNSRIIYLQQIGRILSISNGEKKPVLIDVANNWINQETTAEAFADIGHAIQKGELLILDQEIQEEANLNSNAGNEASKLNENENQKSKINDENAESDENKVLNAEGNINLNEAGAQNGQNFEGRRIPFSYGFNFDEYDYSDLEDQIEGAEERRKYSAIEQEVTDLFNEIDIDRTKQKEDVLKKLVLWLKYHDGLLPRASIIQNGVRVKASEMTQAERDEVNLYAGFRRLNAYHYYRRLREGKIRLEDIDNPKILEELEALKKANLDISPKTEIFDELVNFLKENGRMPRGTISRNGETTTKQDRTEAENKEVNLYSKYRRTELAKTIRNILDGRIKIREITDIDIIKQIKVLKGFGIDISGPMNSENELKKWIIDHDGKFPRKAIFSNNVQKKAGELTDEEKYETNLYARIRQRSIFGYLRKIVDGNMELDDIENPLIQKDVQEYLNLGLKVKNEFQKTLEFVSKNGRFPKYRRKDNKSYDAIHSEEENKLYNSMKNSKWYRAILDMKKGKEGVVGKLDRITKRRIVRVRYALEKYYNAHPEAKFSPKSVVAFLMDENPRRRKAGRLISAESNTENKMDNDNIGGAPDAGENKNYEDLEER